VKIVELFETKNLESGKMFRIFGRFLAFLLSNIARECRYAAKF
jgi:hypothetical protein